MRLDAISKGDVILTFHDSGCMGAQLVYAFVERVNRVTVTVRDERGNSKRVDPAGFHRKLAPHEWRPTSVGGPKTCPMDGDEAEFKDVGGHLRWIVRCCKCRLSTAPYATLGLAQAAWDRRVA